MTKGQHLKTGLPAIIEETAFMLKVGAYSGVIKSQFGWHIVRTAKKSESRRIPFEEVRVSIEKSLEVDKRTQGMKKMLKQLKKKYKVKAYKDRLP
jgi:parvulin-like peptidyl-prolyl isomerase